ncbi:MAG TPA: DUF732 domain-containing protein [Mycobacterium sp.]|nr:DUF732 domain-containing protein [Mycobacterium sp.]
MKPLLTLCGLAVAIGLAGPVHADSTDDSFIASLRAAGITFSDPGKAVGAGRWVCDTVGQGTQMPDVVKTLLSKNSALSQDKANQFAAIAASTYCPSAITTSTPNPS